MMKSLMIQTASDNASRTITGIIMQPNPGNPGTEQPGQGTPGKRDPLDDN